MFTDPCQLIYGVSSWNVPPNPWPFDISCEMTMTCPRNVQSYSGGHTLSRHGFFCMGDSQDILYSTYIYLYNTKREYWQSDQFGYIRQIVDLICRIRHSRMPVDGAWSWINKEMVEGVNQTCRMSKTPCLSRINASRLRVQITKLLDNVTFVLLTHFYSREGRGPRSSRPGNTADNKHESGRI